MNLITKMIGLVAVMVALTLAVSLLGYFNATGIGSALDRFAEEDFPLANAINEITSSQLEQSVLLGRAIVAAEKEQIDTVETATNQFDQLTTYVQEQLQAGREIIAGVVAGSDDPERRERFEQWLETWESVMADYEAFVAGERGLLLVMQSGDVATAKANLPIVEVTVEAMNEQLDQLGTEIAASAGNAAGSASERAAGAASALISAAVIALIVSVALGVLLLQSVRRQLGSDPAELLQFAEGMADGQLHFDESRARGGVARALTRTVGRLREVISGIKASADQVGIAAEQVYHGNTDLSSRTQEQASSLEEVAASMEEMTATVNQNADNAKRAEELAKKAREDAVAGNSVVSETVTAMDMIDESSSRIADILDMIEDISFQTNLLALNAAVEAARAGEHGRGFAVVANEVRKLAGRSSTAAKDIKNLIKESATTVNHGMELVNNAGVALQKIVEGIRGVSDVVSEISAASIEQAEGINQVNKAVVQMEEMTQQNAALVEQAAAASQSMGDQARELTRLVSFFRFDAQAADPQSAQALAEEGHLVEDGDSEGDESRRKTPVKPVAAEEVAMPFDEDDSDWTRF
ncbi:MAG: methyl-accepting chemotaxis protein [Xanthomonadales bacterium]|nr:methyl-accepting chemotaxis protein [Xanthomonadales bacterium]